MKVNSFCTEKNGCKQYEKCSSLAQLVAPFVVRTDMSECKQYEKCSSLAQLVAPFVVRTDMSECKQYEKCSSLARLVAPFVVRTDMSELQAKNLRNYDVMASEILSLVSVFIHFSYLHLGCLYS